MLVCVGVCLIMIVSQYGFQNALRMPHVVLDPARVAAQVVSGVGFLGSGSILMRGNTVRGMTRAASIWAVAALGLAARRGMYFAADIATVVILLILAGLKPIEEAYRARVRSCALHVRGGQIRRLTRYITEEGLEEQTIHLVRVSRSDIKLGAARLAKQLGVQSVEVTRKGKEGEWWD